jgi:hypothetical protein
MRLRRFALALLGIMVSALVAALPVGAKEGVKATLTTRIPLDAPTGIHLKVAWTLFSIDETGQREPFGANGVFVRLLSASGARAEEGVALIGAHSSGEYSATVAVPEGGIGDVKIGLMGWQSDATGTRRSDAIFPITNDPLPGALRVASPASAQPVRVRVDTGSTPWVFVVVAVVLSTLAALSVALVLRKKRGGAARANDRNVQSATPLSASSKAWRD